MCSPSWYVYTRITCSTLLPYTMCISTKGTLGNYSSWHSFLDISKTCIFYCQDAKKVTVESAKLCFVQQFFA